MVEEGRIISTADYRIIVQFTPTQKASVGMYSGHDYLCTFWFCYPMFFILIHSYGEIT